MRLNDEIAQKTNDRDECDPKKDGKQTTEKRLCQCHTFVHIAVIKAIKCLLGIIFGQDFMPRLFCEITTTTNKLLAFQEKNQKYFHFRKQKIFLYSSKVSNN